MINEPDPNRNTNTRKNRINIIEKLWDPFKILVKFTIKIKIEWIASKLCAEVNPLKTYKGKSLMENTHSGIVRG